MQSDQIVEVGIDEQGSLYIRPKATKFPLMYREAMEVGWDEQRHRLFSPKPRESSYHRWFQQLRAGAKEQGVLLQLVPATTWSNVPVDLRQEIEANESDWWRRSILNSAIVLFTGFGARSLPCEDADAVRDGLPAEDARSALPDVQALITELRSFSPNWDDHTLVSASSWAAEKMQAAHPSLDATSIAALKWTFSFWWK
jgi:hypothetical protein